MISRDDITKSQNRIRSRRQLFNRKQRYLQNNCCQNKFTDKVDAYKFVTYGNIPKVEDIVNSESYTKRSVEYTTKELLELGEKLNVLPLAKPLYSKQKRT